MDPKRTLSEISHLFLSEVRDRQQHGATPRPARVPPQKREVPADCTAEEELASLDTHTHRDPRPSPQMGTSHASVVIASHLSDQPSERVRQYARYLAAECGRVGILEVDGGNVAVRCYESHGAEPADAPVQDELDIRRLSETLAELSFDVSRWLIYLPNPRTPEAREVLRHAPHWVLLTTADHDGVVATYRAMKGLAELGKPALSVVVLDAMDEAQAGAVFRKLDAVGRQFLDCHVQEEPSVRPVPDVTEHTLLHCQATKDKAQLANGAPWKLLTDFLSATTAPRASEPHVPAPEPEPEPMPAPAIPRPAAPRLAITDETFQEVIDIPGDFSEQAILDAIARQGGAGGHWVQCPLKAPMCPQAILAVGRDHRLLLLAVAGKGLSELRAIGLALRWMAENRELIRMALPQLAIDADGSPAVRLLVDHADRAADLLQPILQSSAVTVQAYRKLKWAGKTGLLLEAA